MSDLTGHAADFRPRSYFVGEADAMALARVKGTARREAVRELLDSGRTLADVPAALRQESLSDGARETLSAEDPALMGGEYLPDTEEGEVEIARITMESTTADVMSLRARREGGRICYRLDDEYGTDYALEPECSDEPLTFGEIVALISNVPGTSPSELRDLNLGDAPDAGRIEELRDFVRVTSELYLELESYFEDEAESWRAERLVGIRRSTPARR